MLLGHKPQGNGEWGDPLGVHCCHLGQCGRWPGQGGSRAGGEEWTYRVEELGSLVNGHARESSPGWAGKAKAEYDPGEVGLHVV